MSSKRTKISSDLYEKLFSDITAEAITPLESDDKEIYYEEKQYVDSIKDFLTEEQRKRDKKITLILSHYVENYSNKVTDNKIFKRVLFVFCLAFIFLFSASLVTAIIIISVKSNNNISSVVSFVSACATLITVPIGVFKIIVSYIFPSSEEKHIANIVQLIQQNDLENKKTNISALAKNDNNEINEPEQS